MKMKFQVKLSFRQIHIDSFEPWGMKIKTSPQVHLGRDDGAPMAAVGAGRTVKSPGGGHKSW